MSYSYFASSLRDAITGRTAFSLMTVAVLASLRGHGQEEFEDSPRLQVREPSVREQVTPQPTSGDFGGAEEKLETQDDASQAFFEEAMRYMARNQRPWKVRTTVRALWLHDSNVRLVNDGAQKDNIFSVRPGVQFYYGSPDSWLQTSVDYHLNANYFERFSEENSLNHFISSSTTMRSSKVTWTTVANWTRVRGGDLDVGGQAQRDWLDLRSILTYDITQRTTLGGSFTLDSRDYHELIDFGGYMAGGFVDYTFKPKLRLGVQGNYFLDSVPQGESMEGQQYLGRVSWMATGKLSVEGSAGIETRTSSGYKASSHIGSFGLRYVVSPKTSITANVYRRGQLSPSLADQFFYADGALLGLSQQVGSRWSIGTEFGFERSEYAAITRDVMADRADEVLFVRPWLRYRLSKRLTAEAYYQHTRNDSSGTGSRSFERDLVGLGAVLSW